MWAKPEGDEPVTRALEGPLDCLNMKARSAQSTDNHGLPRFRNVEFEAAYPLGQVLLSDADVPLDVRLQAFNPLIPGDSERSGIPVAILRYVLTNKTTVPVEASVCGVCRNFIGTDGYSGKTIKNRNILRRAERIDRDFSRFRRRCARCRRVGDASRWRRRRRSVTYRTDWANYSWGDALLDFWDDFSDDGRLEARAGDQGDSPTACLAAGVTVPPAGSVALTFLLTWHFPNRITWTPKEASANASEPCCAPGEECAPSDANPNWIGNYYTTKYRDAWDVAVQTVGKLPELEADTLQFVRAFCESDLPQVVKEAALFNLSTLRTQTCFRTADGRFYGWEGCGDKSGCCHGSCTHVWNYEQATALLFGDLSRSMREVEFAARDCRHGPDEFPRHLPLTRVARSGALAAADGQMGCLMKLLPRLAAVGRRRVAAQSLWPQAKKALEFCWIEGGWDADQDGVMEGCQHNTMDVEYYGPNPQMGVWYLGALRAMEEMARHLGDAEFARRCRGLFEQRQRAGSTRTCSTAIITSTRSGPPRAADAIAPGLRHDAWGRKTSPIPNCSLARAVWSISWSGSIWPISAASATCSTRPTSQQRWQAFMRYNFQTSLHGHFNHMRTFALGDEAAMLMATYPKGRRPKRPFPYYNEVMTGFEYTAAVGMLQEGQDRGGLTVIRGDPGPL